MPRFQILPLLLLAGLNPRITVAQDIRLPLVPAELVEKQKLVLIGDMPLQPQGRAWIMQSAAELAKLGITQVGFETLRSDYQPAIDAYRDGRYPREKLLALFLGDNDVRYKVSRRIAMEETVSAIDTLNFAGLQVVALGLSADVEEQAYRELSGKTKKELKQAGVFRRTVKDIRAPLDQLQSDALAARITEAYEQSPKARMIALVSPGRLSKYSTAGRLGQSGIEAKTCGFFFPESDGLNLALQSQDTTMREAKLWAYVPLSRKNAGMDALLLAPADLLQPPLR